MPSLAMAWSLAQNCCQAIKTRRNYLRRYGRRGVAIFPDGSGGVPNAFGIPTRLYPENSVALTTIGPYFWEF